MTSGISTTQPRTWSAQWIWGEGDAAEVNVYRYFRRALSLDSGAARDLTLHVFSGGRYRLYVNGVAMGEGPVPSSHAISYFDSYALRDHLRDGENVIALVVHHIEDAVKGVTAELVDGAGAVVAASDASWRTKAAEAWWPGGFRFGMNKYDPYQEFHDGRLVPVGWDAPGFDDGNWSAASELGAAPAFGPITEMLARDIPHLPERALAPAQVVKMEENIALGCRLPKDNLSVALSLPGQPLKHARIDNEETLLAVDDTGTPSATPAEAIVQCSTEHLRDITFDGVYDPTIVFDLGRLTTAWVELELDGVAGGQVDIGVAERLTDGHFVNSIEGQFCTRYTMRDGVQTFRNFAWRGLRYVKLRFRDCYHPVKLRAVRIVETRYPFEQRGAFESNDERLNRVWGACRATIWLCCHESIMDTPWREQAQWLGDVALVSLGGIYACFGDTALPAKFLRQSAAVQREMGLIPNITNCPAGKTARGDIPDYSLWWIYGAWRHYLYTGDRALLASYYETAKGIVDAHARHIDETGLINDMPHWVFIDWAYVDKRGRCAALNAIFYRTLVTLMQMAEELELSQESPQYEAVRTGIAASFDAHFYDASREIYIDCHADGVASPRVSEQTNFAAIWAGLCSRERAVQIAETLLLKRSVPAIEAQPFFSAIVLQALDEIGRFDLAMQYIGDRWGRRFVDRGYDTCLEEWGHNGSWRNGDYLGFMRTHSHAWSAHPGEFLIRNLIGLEIMEPGGSKVRVTPRDVDFDYAVAYPLPLGNLRVIRRGGQITVEAPAGVAMVP